MVHYGDKVPLNKSFDTAETSSTYSEDLMSRRISSLLSSDDESERENDRENEGRLTSSSLKVDLPRPYDPFAQYSIDRKTGVAPKDTGDELSVGTMVANNMSQAMQDDEDDSSVSSFSSFYRTLIGLKETLKSPWKEDRPFDEESILESELGEGVETIYGIGVYTGRKQNIDPASSILNVDREKDATDVQDPIDITCSTRGAKSTNEDEDKPKRKRALFCCCCLIFLIAIVVALVLGIRRDNDEQQVSQASAFGNEGIVNESAAPWVSISNSPTATPSDAGTGNETSAPSMDFTGTGTPNTAPVLNPTTNHPIAALPTPVPTRFPTRVPTPAPSTKAPLSTPAPTTNPTLAPVPDPTPLPTQNPTKAPASTPSPTKNPTLAPVSDPTPLPSPNPTVRPPVPPSPTPFPTISPTLDPTTSSPTACQNQVLAEQLCHVQGEDLLIIRFIMCDTIEGDWVGIYMEEDAQDPNDLDDNYVTWAYTCGGQRCTDPPRENRFAFSTANIERARFQAFLIPGSIEDPPYTSVAISESFIVASEC